MKLDEIIQQPGQMERVQQQATIGKVNVARPGMVIRYDENTKCVDVQLTVRDLHSNKTPPVLTGVPVVFIGSFTFDIKVGDECLVIFADSSIDGWWQTGKVSNPVTGRRHDLSDGFALVGVHSAPNAGKGTNLDDVLVDATALADRLEKAIAIVAVNNSHIAINKGQYVYIKKHDSMIEGLYIATKDIAVNVALTPNNVAPSSAVFNGLAKKIFLESGDVTWGRIWNKIDGINTGDAAVIYIYADAMSVLSDGALTQSYAGILWRTASGTFRLHVGNTGNNVVEATISNATSTSKGTFTYKCPNVDISNLSGVVDSLSGTVEDISGAVDVLSEDVDDLSNNKLDKTSVYDGLDKTTTGFALDAYQGKVLNDAVGTKLNSANVLNNLTTTSAGYALDARQGKSLNDKKVEKIVLGSDVDSWEKVWAKISALSSGDTAGFYAVGAAYGVLSNGVRSSQCMGIIARYSSSAFQLFLRFTNVYGLYASLTDASSSTRGTYAEGTLCTTYNYLDRTTSGYALDARQGKVLNDKIRNDPIVYQASATTHTFTVGTNSRNFVVFGGDGLSYTYLGYVYGNSSGGVTHEDLYAGSRISAIGVSTNKISFTFSQASSCYLRNVNLRGDPIS